MLGGEECGRLDYCTCYHALIMHHSCIIVVFLCHDIIIISYLSAKYVLSTIMREFALSNS